MSSLLAHLSPRIGVQPPFGKRESLGWRNLSSNELQHPDLQRVLSSFLEECGRQADLGTYPAFSAALRECERRFDVPEGACLITPGADLAIRAILETFGARGRLVCPMPCYRAYPDYAAAFGLDLEGVDALRADERVLVDQLARAISRDAPCLAALADPDGATGGRLSSEGRRRLADLARRTGSLLIFDEAYMAFAARTDLPSIELDDHVLTIRTFSKSHGAAGLRLAVVVGPPALIELVARTRVANGLSRPALEYVRFILSRRDAFRAVIEDICTWRDDVDERLRPFRAACGLPSSAANFMTIDLGSAAALDRFTAGLSRRKIRVRTFLEAPSFKHCVRVTVAPPPVLEEVLACLPS